MVWKCLRIPTQRSGSDFSCKGVSWVPGKSLFSTIIQIELAKYTFNNSTLRVVHVLPSPHTYPSPPFLKKSLFYRGFYSDTLSKTWLETVDFPSVQLAPLSHLKRAAITSSAQTIREAFIEHQMFAFHEQHPESPPGFHHLFSRKKANSQGGIQDLRGKLRTTTTSRLFPASSRTIYSRWRCISINQSLL